MAESVTAYATGRATTKGYVVDVCVSYYVEDDDAKEAETELKGIAHRAVASAKKAVEKAKEAQRSSRSSQMADDDDVFEVTSVSTSLHPEYVYDARPPQIVSYKGSVNVCVTATTQTAEMVLSTFSESTDSKSGSVAKLPPAHISVSDARLSKTQREDMQALAVKDATRQAEKKIAATVEAMRGGDGKDGKSVRVGRVTNVMVDYIPDDFGGGGGGNGGFGVARSLSAPSTRPQAMASAMSSDAPPSSGNAQGLSISHPRRIDVHAQVLLTRQLRISS